MAAVFLESFAAVALAGAVHSVEVRAAVLPLAHLSAVRTEPPSVGSGGAGRATGDKVLAHQLGPERPSEKCRLIGLPPNVGRILWIRMIFSHGFCNLFMVPGDSIYGMN